MGKAKQPGENMSLKTRKNEHPAVMAWINAQTNLMDSIRYLIEKEVQGQGIRNLQLYVPAERGWREEGGGTVLSAAGQALIPASERNGLFAAPELAAGREVGLVADLMERAGAETPFPLAQGETEQRALTPQVEVPSISDEDQPSVFKEENGPRLQEDGQADDLLDGGMAGIENQQAEEEVDDDDIASWT